MEKINQMINGKREGLWEIHYPDGTSSKGLYCNGLEEGWWESYMADGKVRGRSHYVNGKRDRPWEFYGLIVKGK